METITTPKFQIGNAVRMSKKTLYDETEGMISEVEKVFQELHRNSDEIDTDGLMIRESDIKNICLPYEFDGEKYLSIQYSSDITCSVNRTKKYKFCGYAYTITTPKMSSIYPEKSLRLI